MRPTGLRRSLGVGGGALCVALAVTAPAVSSPAASAAGDGGEQQPARATTARVQASRATSFTPGGSLVYVRHHNLWIASPDGTVKRQLTFNGKARHSWNDPSVGGGKIFAFRDKHVLVKGKDNLVGRISVLNQAGRSLGSFEPDQPNSADSGVLYGGGILSISAHKSGKFVAWQPVYECPDPDEPKIEVCYFTEVAKADGSNSYLINGKADMSFMGAPSWSTDDPDVLLLSRHDGAISYYPVGQDLGGADPPDWFGSSDPTYRTDPDMASGRVRGAKRLAVATTFINDDFSQTPVIALLRENGLAPQEPTTVCNVVKPPAGSFEDPTWGPRGSYLAWGESDGDATAPEPSGEGIWVTRVEYLGDSDCRVNTINGRLAPVIADGERPEWAGPMKDAVRRNHRNVHQVEFLAGAQTDNEVALTRTSKGYRIADTSRSIAAGRSCKGVRSHVARCGTRAVRSVKALGLDGNDVLVSDLAVPVVLYGGTGRDRLRGGSGNDRLKGGPGADRISGGRGADAVYTRDHVADVVSCGPGRDLLVADRVDVRKGCEKVRVPAAR